MTTIAITDKYYIKEVIHEQNECKYSLHYLMLEIQNNKEIGENLTICYKMFLENKNK